jgi:hypothetical protein
MEVNTAPVDECMEGCNDVQLRADEHVDEGSADLLLHIHHGQLQIRVHVLACSKLAVVLTDSLLSYACGCAGVETAKCRDCTLQQPDGHWWCSLCLHRIEGKQPSGPCGANRAHKSCLVRQNRHAVVTNTPVARAKRSYDTLQPTQKRERRKQALMAVTDVLDRVGCPFEAIQSSSTPSPADLIHLPTSVRHQIRTVTSLHIPCEQSMISCKQQLAVTHATETGTFAVGAYITDPLRFASVLCAQTLFIAVGGDCGGGHTKLGITYSVNSFQHYAALLVYEGKDNWDELNKLTTTGLTPFSGESAAFPHIFAVLQHIIDTRGAFLNGDWPFINGLLGLMSLSATHPCPICIVSHNNFFGTSRYRTPEDKHSVDSSHSALLTILPERIVPIPLHLELGISNRILLNVYTVLLGESVVKEMIRRIKTVHSAGRGGLSDLHELNGPEIHKLIRTTKKRRTSILADVAASCALPAAKMATHSILKRWLEQIHHSLLRSGDWTSKEIDGWRDTVKDIHAHWKEETKSGAFPKLHMLHHTIDFAERHRFLGRVSEAQIESFHATFNSLFHKQHHNQAHNTAERLRRSLADAVLRAVQPFL